VSLFGDLPETIPTGDLLKIISPLISKQENISFKNALKRISDTITVINNPNDIKCKLVTTFGDIFTQPKRRLYLQNVDDKLVFYDADFSKPKGEIICDLDDVESYGTFSQYPLRINSSGGGKINPDALVLKIKDTKHEIYFEFQKEVYDELKKILPRKKELK
jgi:hypothetical protein